MIRRTLFGFDFISDDDHQELLAELRGPMHRHGMELPILITPNVDQVVKCHRPENTQLFVNLKRSKYILPDGQPIVWVSRLLKGRRLRSRLTGSDLFPLFWKQVITDGTEIGLFLPNREVGVRLKTEYAHCHFVVAGDIDTSLPHTIDEAVQQCLALIVNNDLKFLCFGVGFPKQEIIALALIEELEKRQIPAPFMLLLGASFEFYVGVKKRSPKFIQRLGLEFAHRMFSEPRRMIKRYLIDDSDFFRLAAKEILQ